MTTPHRGLPPPAGMALSSSQGPPDSLELLPPYHGGSEECYKTWLMTRSDLEKRRAEEERTRQDQFKLETRRLEFEMMREAISYRIPPPLVPLVFMGSAGGGGGRDGQLWAQELFSQYLSMPQYHQQAITGVVSPTHTPALRRETRSIQQMHLQPSVTPASSHPTPPTHAQQHMGPPIAVGATGGVASAAVAVGGTSAASVAQSPVQYQTYQLPPSGASRTSHMQSTMSVSHPAPPRSHLPRLSTGEFTMVHPHAPGPMGPPNPQQSQPQHSQHHSPPQDSAPAPQQTVTQQPIFFHHWSPPEKMTASSSSSAAAAAAAASPRHLDSPFSHQPSPNALSDLPPNSPKKRKITTQTQHQPPPPANQPFSPMSSPAQTPKVRRGHSRNRSETNPARMFEPYTRPATRQRRSLGSGEERSIGEALGIRDPRVYQPGTGGDSGGSGSGTPAALAPFPGVQEQQQQRGRELRDRELRDRELRDRELRDRELRDRELRDRELRDRELRDRELRDREQQERENRERENRERENRERENRERENRERENRERENRERENRERENRERENREREHHHQRQQSAPASQHSQSPSRPHNAGPEFRRESYHPSTLPPLPPLPPGDPGERGGGGIGGDRDTARIP
ncbi:hypothetical protein BZA77DRAFT_2767 [Pyronema omphalodes]|nr:hypothetical protein BZA77DRAFT_2767 [Pyronema omphalodes]